LFRIRTESFSLISQKGASDNKKLKELKFSFRFDDADKTLHVLLSEQSVDNQLGSDFFYEQSKNEVTVYRTTSTDLGAFRIQLEYKTGNRLFSDTFSITLADSNHLYYAAVDFGSEASQIKYLESKQQNTNFANKINIIKQLQDELNNTEKNFWQEDSPGNTDLYRSVFPINENLTNNFN